MMGTNRYTRLSKAYRPDHPPGNYYLKIFRTSIIWTIAIYEGS
jgi:hypothetical protein